MHCIAIALHIFLSPNIFLSFVKYFYYLVFTAIEVSEVCEWKKRNVKLLNISGISKVT